MVLLIFDIAVSLALVLDKCSAFVGCFGYKCKCNVNDKLTRELKVLNIPSYTLPFFTITSHLDP